jgi:hydrogenase maturation protein HypF
MCLEACARPVTEFPSLPIAADTEGLPRIDWAPLLEYCSDTSLGAADRAGAVHAALADAIVRVAEAERSRSGATVVGLTGGVFQNRLLLESAAARLEQGGFRVLMPGRIPCNDGGLSYGQVAEHVGRTAATAP